ncbi:MAG: dephospho-CoA kinase [Spirochaetales bacterium]
MTVVGITGKYCSGKSTVTSVLVDHGYHEIDVDAVGHEALEECADEVIATFGEEVRAGGRAAVDSTTKNRDIDRKALGRIVFSSKDRLRELEAILHPVMVRKVRDTVEELGRSESPPAGVAINAAILGRMGLDTLCDVILFVSAPFFARFRRARERDGVSFFDFVKRVASQRDVATQFSSANAEIKRVENDGDRRRLEEQLTSLLP